MLAKTNSNFPCCFCVSVRVLMAISCVMSMQAQQHGLTNTPSSKEQFAVSSHNVQCQNDAKAHAAEKYEIWTNRCGVEFSKCPNDNRTAGHDRLLLWQTYTNGLRFSCQMCKDDNAKSPSAVCYAIYCCLYFTNCDV